MLKVKFESNVSGVLKEQHVPTATVQETLDGQLRELMRANLWTDEDRGCDGKDDVPAVVTLAKTFYTNEAFSEVFHDIESTRNKMLEAGPD